MNEFLEAWSLFGAAWATAVLLGMLLPCCGAVLVARGQVFLGASVGQAATFGMALALVLGFGHGGEPDHAHTETFALSCALAAGAAVTVLAMRAISAGRASLEGVSAWVFLLGGAGTVLLLQGAPHGMQEVQRLQLSSLLTVSGYDAWIAGAGLLATVLAGRRSGDAVLLWAIDPATARALGVGLVRYDVVVGAWLGLCLGFSIHVAGLLFSFGLCVLPVLALRAWTVSLRRTLWMAPVLGGLACVCGVVVSHWLDLPPGQTTVGVLGLLLAAGHAKKVLA